MLRTTSCGQHVDRVPCGKTVSADERRRLQTGAGACATKAPSSPVPTQSHLSYAPLRARIGLLVTRSGRDGGIFLNASGRCENRGCSCFKGAAAFSRREQAGQVAARRSDGFNAESFVNAEHNCDHGCSAMFAKPLHDKGVDLGGLPVGGPHFRGQRDCHILFRYTGKSRQGRSHRRIPGVLCEVDRTHAVFRPLGRQSGWPDTPQVCMPKPNACASARKHFSVQSRSPWTAIVHCADWSMPRAVRIASSAATWLIPSMGYRWRCPHHCPAVTKAGLARALSTAAAGIMRAGIAATVHVEQPLFVVDEQGLVQGRLTADVQVYPSCHRLVDSLAPSVPRDQLCLAVRHGASVPMGHPGRSRCSDARLCRRSYRPTVQVLPLPKSYPYWPSRRPRRGIHTKGFCLRYPVPGRIAERRAAILP